MITTNKLLEQLLDPCILHVNPILDVLSAITTNADIRTYIYPYEQFSLSHLPDLHVFVHFAKAKYFSYGAVIISGTITAWEITSVYTEVLREADFMT